VNELKVPTKLDFDVAELHGRALLRKGKTSELCKCSTCSYVQSFIKSQMIAHMQQQCAECGEPCEEEEE